MNLANQAMVQAKTVYVFFVLFLIVGCSGTSAEFQKDADIVRLQHLKYYGNLLEEYNEKAGHYPFQEQKEVPVYVHIANDQQIEYTKQGPPSPHEVISFKDFVKEVETVLGKEISEFYDPQYRPVNKPNFYIYMVTGDAFFFAVHLHHPFPFATKIANHYYKVELSNHPNSQNKAILPERLFGSPEFEAEVNKSVSKETFFREREKKYLHYTKTI